MYLQISLMLNKLAKYRALIIFLAAASTGYYFLHDYLSFEMLREHRETLLSFRDSNYIAAVLRNTKPPLGAA